MFVTEFIPKFKISLLAQLRIGILPLNIEVGRYYGIDLENRVCTLCHQNEVEDEIHFMMLCPIYSNIRSYYFDKFKLLIEGFNQLDLYGKYIALLNCKKVKIAANYVETLWNIRKSKLFTV